MPFHYLSMKKKAAMAILFLLNEDSEDEKSFPPPRRRVWCKNVLPNRDNIPQDNPLRELRLSAPEEYRNCLRMSDVCFEHLLSVVTPYIQKQETCMRKPISAEQRLIATLRFLATGRPLQDLKFSTGISPKALGDIIPETCAAIISGLRDEYMKFPKTPEEWMSTAAEFNSMWNFPNCGGAIGGKHVGITPPPGCRTYYYNYRGFFSIVLMAIVNARYEFIMIDIGKNVHESDEGIFEDTKFHKKMVNKQLNLPSTKETVNGLNFVFVGDEAFGLHENLLKPFMQKKLDQQQRIFNYRLSRARKVVEDTFDILANTFRVFHTSINLRLDKVELVVFACCLLHNYLRRHSSRTNCTPLVIEPDLPAVSHKTQKEVKYNFTRLVDMQPVEPHNHSADARDNRLRYMKYFNTTGAVEGQNSMAI